MATSKQLVVHPLMFYSSSLKSVVKEEQRKNTEGRMTSLQGGPSEAEIAVSKVLEKLAKDKGSVMTSVA